MPAEFTPVEVTLVNEVKSCRSCKWFWEGIPPYGPFPAFGWEKEFPEDILNHPETTMDREAISWSQANSVGVQLVEPAVLRGCRKAPIMTLGINPNLTAYFPDQDGARWAYPFFKNDSTYAYYYRHASVFQESMPLEFIEEHTIEGSEVIAEKDGWLLGSQRGSDHRWLELTVQYEGDSEPQYHEMSWKPEERAVVFFDRSYNTNGDVSFKAGEVIAAKIRTPDNSLVDIYANGTGYYQRLIPVLERFSERTNQALPIMGEDVSMHDMVACASPGWSDSYDIPRETIIRHCVNKHDYVLRQLIQSRPTILIIVSTSSLLMFAESLEAAGGCFDFEYKDRDIYDLLRETTQRKCYLDLTHNGVTVHTQVLLTPHFSYFSNFRPQARFSLNAWNAFKEEFPNDAQTLEEEGIIQDTTWNNYVPLKIDDKNDPIQNKLGVNAWEIILARFYDPYELLTDALVKAYDEGILQFDNTLSRMTRSEGDCQFCKNEQWSFPEGCPYGKV